MKFDQTYGIVRIKPFVRLIDVLVSFGTRVNTWIDPYTAGIDTFGWLNKKPAKHNQEPEARNQAKRNQGAIAT